jgi:ABC-2 type transport system permease protein
MKKFWLILVNEYKRHVLRKRFIFAILSFPLMVVFIILVSYLSVGLNYDSRPVGYVDASHILPTSQQLPADPSKLLKRVDSIQYPDESSATAALKAGSIQAYFVLSENYMKNGSVTMVTIENPSNNARSDFGDFVTYNLASSLPASAATRLIEGNNMIIRSLDGSREMNADDWISVLLPLLSGVLFIVMINISGGYLLQAVVEEKENRTLEILVTSVSPIQLMGGKITGDLLVGLTQLVTWILFAVLGLIIAPRLLPVDLTVHINAADFLLLAATFIPASILTAGLMGTVGAMSTNVREAQQIAGIFTLPMIIPFWFISTIMFAPNSPVAVAMSLFPFTAPIALPMRAVFTPIPTLQILISLGLLWVLAILSLWLAGRVFRLGMLRYGKRMSFREIFQHA